MFRLRMRTLTFIVALTFTQLAMIHAQDAAPSSVNMTPDQLVSPEPKGSPTPIPDVPALSTLDEGFKRPSIGKDGDESRQRIEIRRLKNQIANDAQLTSAKKNAEASPTDLEKRERLRDYYELYYSRLRRSCSDSGTRKLLEEEEAEHLKLLDQPRVRPVPGGTIPPIPKKEKTVKKKKSRFGQALSQHAKD